jgi:hypothetical protein
MVRNLVSVNTRGSIYSMGGAAMAVNHPIAKGAALVNTPVF